MDTLPPAHTPSARQVLGGSAAPGDAARRRDVVRGDAVPQVQQDVGVLDGLQGNRLFGLKGRGSCRHLTLQESVSSAATFRRSEGRTALTSLSKNEGHLMYVDFKSHGNNTDSGASREFHHLFPTCERGVGWKPGEKQKA